MKFFGDPYKGELPESMRRLSPSGRSELIKNMLTAGVLVALVAVAGIALIQDLDFSTRFAYDDYRVIGAVPASMTALGLDIVVNDDCESYRAFGNQPHSHWDASGGRVCTTRKNFEKRPYLREEMGLTAARYIAPLIPEPSNLTVVTLSPADSPNPNGGFGQPKSGLAGMANAILSEWSHVRGGNLHDDGVTDDIATYMNAIYRDGPAREKLRESGPFGPYREKVEILYRFGLVDPQRYREVLEGY